MSNLELAREWFKLAEMDLSSAAYLKNMKPIPSKLSVTIASSPLKNHSKVISLFKAMPSGKRTIWCY